MRSLQGRVALAAGLALTIFVLLTSVALDRAFHEGVSSAREERLLGQLFLLMAAAEADDDGWLSVPEDFAQTHFGRAESGPYAEILDATGRVIWASPSAQDLDLPFHGPLPVNERRFEQRSAGAGAAYLVASYGVSWATGPVTRSYTFAVAEGLEAYEVERSRYRLTLFVALGFLALTLVGVLTAALRWGLSPLRRIEAEIAAVERGERDRLEGAYPSELQGLADRLNTLLSRERAMQRRLRNSLGDLAHSLKTPLAVLRGINAEPSPDRAGIEQQVARLNEVVDFQLQRALAGSGSRLGSPLPVRPVVEKVLGALAKLHRGKGVRAVCEVEGGVSFRGGEEDLVEILGNTLENAYKWCRSTVQVRATRAAEGLAVVVEDDGLGIAPADAERLLERGVRGDETTPGHGIGLAVVREIAEAYGGRVTIGRSALGGAAFTVQLHD
jgi:two-component system sensor histidine kinase PhoQ